MNDPATERLLDIMLEEALESAAPPDLTEQIMAALDSGTDSSNVQIQVHQPQVKHASSWMTFVLAASVVFVIAAIGWSIGNHSDTPSVDVAQQDPPKLTVDRDHEAIAVADPEIPIPSVDVITPRDSGSGTEDFDIDMNELPFGNPTLGALSSNQPTENRVVAGIKRMTSEQIVAKLDQHMSAAWARLDISPLPAVADDQLVRRIARVTTGDGDVALPEVSESSIAKVVRSPSAATFMGRKWGERTFGRHAWNRLDDEQRRDVAELMASCFSGQTSFSDLVYDMLSGHGSSSPDDPEYRPTSLWLAKLGDNKSIAVTNQFCDAFLDVDVSCGRCHSHPLERRIAQQDYWNLNAVFATSNVKSGKTVFYEAADGRQLVAKPAIAAQWFATGSLPEGPIDQSQLAAIVRDSDQLAQSTVNGIWQLVFGSRLVGRTSDPLAPPSDEDFVEARDMLAKQLQAHNYDLGAAVSWIVASKPMRLGVAKSLMDTGSLAADPDELEQADLQKRSFAAFTHSDSTWSFSELVAAAESFNRGSSISDQVLLAQPASEGKPNKARSPSKSELRSQALMRSFPHQASHQGLPAGWLDSLSENGGFEEQAKHLFYVAGYSIAINTKQLQAAQQIRRSANDDEAALNQLWWAIRLSKSGY